MGGTPDRGKKKRYVVDTPGVVRRVNECLKSDRLVSTGIVVRNPQVKTGGLINTPVRTSIDEHFKANPKGSDLVKARQNFMDKSLYQGVRDELVLQSIR